MRSDLTALAGNHFWQRTDDGQSRCAFGDLLSVARFYARNAYELGAANCGIQIRRAMRFARHDRLASLRVSGLSQAFGFLRRFVPQTNSSTFDVRNFGLIKGRIVCNSDRFHASIGAGSMSRPGSRWAMQYRCEATSVEGFVQMVAANYLPHGYWFFVTGFLPRDKDCHQIDRKLIEKYEVDITRPKRARRKRAGMANVHYLRHRRFFALLATHGQHRFFNEESDIKDIRHAPLKFAGYSISYRRGGCRPKAEHDEVATPDSKWHSHVEIDRRQYLELKAYFLELATRRTDEQLAVEFSRIPFEPYAPVRRQLLNILRAVNRSRKAAGLTTLPFDTLRYRRRIVRPFEPVGLELDSRMARASGGRCKRSNRK